MNSVLKQRLLRLKDVQDIANAVQHNCLPEKFGMIIKSRMPWAEKTLWKIAALSVSTAINLRQRRTSRQLLKLSASEGKRQESRDRHAFHVQERRAGKGKSLVRS
jgi:hypothetical protein